MRLMHLMSAIASLGMAQAAVAADLIFVGDNECRFVTAAMFDSAVATTADCTYGKSCKNDEARSLSVGPDVKPGTIIRVWDNPKGAATDDYAQITIKTVVGNHPFYPTMMCIPTFEANRSGADYDISYHRVNGLDGKVSRIQIVPAPKPHSPVTKEQKATIGTRQKKAIPIR